MINKWFEFSPEVIKRSAGIIVILNNKRILFCHPSNAKWYGSYSFPKGGVNEGESDIDAAIREMREETSIEIGINQISNIDSPFIVDYATKKGQKYKKLILYTSYIDSLSDIGLDSLIVPVGNLQIEEIDWAGFLTRGEAKSRSFHRISHLLNEI